MSYKDKLTIDDVELRGKRVLVRVDYNVPLDGGVIQDDKRIRETLPTIRKILDDGGSAILMSHCGRPKGKRDSALSLKPVAVRLGELLGREVKFVDDCVGELARKVRAESLPGDVVLLENLRFHPEEEDCDDAFARELAEGADIFVNDAFAATHRSHASTVAVAGYIPVAVLGYLVLREMEMLQGPLANPKRPFMAIIGGIKVSSKIAVIENLLDSCDQILIGGAMACTFFTTLGIMSGSAFCETDFIDTARQILEKAGSTELGAGKLFLPIDAIVTDEISPEGKRAVATFEDIPKDFSIVDIGPDTIARFKKELANAQTIIMNGPLGAFEVDQFSHGTREIFKSLAERFEAGATVVLGGGDTASAAKKFGLENRATHISTGGGASLKVLEGKPLPAIEILTDKDK
ncbi:MAG TPA: phosphoglycerate kinase [candidate division Zixibacteria bacterium]|nr:phosphoglycerate kinase [candidate division Zixibacteria bacterium]